MRIFAAFLFPAVIAAGNAHASSILLLEAMQDSIGPSMILIGAPPGVTVDVPGGPSIMTVAGADSQAFPSVTFLSEPLAVAAPSIIALGEPAISDEEVAAIPRSADKNGMGPTPMVIRGGLVGEASVRPGQAGASQASAPGQLPALDPNDKGTPAKRKALKRQQQLMEQQEASAPAAAPEPAEPPEE